MVNLTSLIIVPLFILVIILIIANYGNKTTIRLVETNSEKYISQVEEIKLMIPYVLRTFYKNVINSNLNLITSILTT